MIRKGIKFKRAWHLGWRCADPSVDKYTNGIPIQMENVVIFSRNTNLSIPLTFHSKTNMAYGKWRGGYAKPGETCPVYLVEDGDVYSGRIRRSTETPI
jgi:hypothetical protein